jgi:hypothetical protein
MNEAIEVMADQVEELNVVSFFITKQILRKTLGMTDIWLSFAFHMLTHECF